MIADNGDRLVMSTNMANSIYVIQSCAVSVDGFIDDTSPKRLVLSCTRDKDRVDEVRSHCDAILVGAGTIRADDPKLAIKSEKRRRERVFRGLAPELIKVTITRCGHLDRNSRFFLVGEGLKIVYCPQSLEKELRDYLGDRAEVVASEGENVNPHSLLEDLRKRGVKRLMVEGGSAVGTMFLNAGLVDELRLAIAPFFVGEEGAPRFVNAGKFPHDKSKRMSVQKVEQVGDMCVVTYKLDRSSRGGGIDPR